MFSLFQLIFEGSIWRTKMKKIFFFIFSILICAVISLDDEAFGQIFLEAEKQLQQADAQQFASGYQTRITPGHGRRASTKE
jgi:hypothetical protein